MNNTESQGLFTKTAKGMAWTYASYFLSKVFVFLSTVILARLLLPEQFGLVGYALLVISYLNSVGSFGISEAFIYQQDRSEEAADISFWINLLAGAVWTGLVFFVAPLIATFFKDDAVIPILQVMSSIFFIRHLGLTHEAILRRKLAFKQRFLPDFILAISKGIVAVGLALMGWGVWSLVWGQIIGMTASTLVLWKLVGWRPQFKFPIDLVKRMLRYGGHIVSVNVLAAITHHVDEVIVARMLGTAALGFYSLAVRIPELFISMLIWSIGKVMFPTFTKIQEDEKRLQRTFLVTVRYLSLLTIPMGVGLALLARPLIVTIYGRTWEPSATVLQALAISLMLRSLAAPAGDIYKATGRTHILTKIGLLTAVFLVPTCIWTAQYGITGIAIAQLSVTGTFELLSVLIACKILKISVFSVAKELKMSLFGCLSMVLSIVLVRYLGGWDAGSWNGLGVSLVVGFCVYALVTWWMNPETYQRFWNSFFARKEEKRDNDHSSEDYIQHRRYWIPTSRERILRFYLANLFIPYSFFEFLKRRILLKFPWLTGKILSNKAQDSVRTDHPLTTICNEMCYYKIRDHLEKSQMNCPRFSDCLIFEDHKYSQSRHTIYFLFDKEASAPCAILKAGDGLNSREILQREFETLKFLRKKMDASMLTTIPQPLAFFEHEGSWVLLESFIPGKSFYAEIRNTFYPKRVARRHFSQANEWLIKFHRSTQTSVIQLTDKTIQKYVWEPLQDFSNLCKPTLDEQKMIFYIQKYAKKLKGKTLPVVASQGNFWPSNFLVEEDRVGIVNFEYFEKESLPFKDLFMLPASYSMYYPWRYGNWGQPTDTFSAAFLEKTWISDLVKEYLMNYCEKMDIAPECIEVFFPIFLARQAMEQKNLSTEASKEVYRLWRKLLQKYSREGGSVCFG
jgi:PST family polysaccharide transporter